MKEAAQKISFLFWPLLSAIALMLCLCGCETGDGHRHYHPEVSVPDGHEQAFQLSATGVQIYSWTGTNWAFREPEATLFDAEKKFVGKHYKGPAWEGIDGSKVTAKVVTNAPAYNPNSIPHLLLTSDKVTGTGIFSGVTYIQRVDTVGGKAPADPGTNAGQEARVDYSAAYVFYRLKK